MQVLVYRRLRALQKSPSSLLQIIIHAVYSVDLYVLPLFGLSAVVGVLVAISDGTTLYEFILIASAMLC